jgi:hypothetical protein
MKCYHISLERVGNKIVCKDCREVVEVRNPLFEMDGATPVDAVEAIQHALNGSDWGKADDNEQKHLQHGFYKESEAYREQIRIGQIIKGAHKYPEPFDPFNWSPKELLAHAMQENVDQAHYEYGLYLWIDRMIQQLEKAEKLIKSHEEVGKKYHQEIIELKKERDEWKHEARLAHEEITFLASERENWRNIAINNHDCRKDTKIHWGPECNQIIAVTCNQCGKVIMGELVDKEV